MYRWWAAPTVTGTAHRSHRCLLPLDGTGVAGTGRLQSPPPRFHPPPPQAVQTSTSITEASQRVGLSTPLLGRRERQGGRSVLSAGGGRWPAFLLEEGEAAACTKKRSEGVLPCQVEPTPCIIPTTTPLRSRGRRSRGVVST